MAYNNPRLTVSTRDCSCADCNKLIKKGETVVVVPKYKQAYCYKCGKKHLK